MERMGLYSLLLGYMCFLATATMQQAVYNCTGSGSNQNTLRYCCANFHVSNFIWAIVTGL